MSHYDDSLGDGNRDRGANCWLLVAFDQYRGVSSVQPGVDPDVGISDLIEVYRQVSRPEGVVLGLDHPVATFIIKSV